MRKIIIITIVSLFLFPSCLEVCKDKDVTAFGYLPEMNKYFGMYKQGNWWVYKNQDSTKTDSIYITDFIERIKKDKNDCITYPTREFRLNSLFITSGTNILKGEFINNRNCCNNTFNCGIVAKMNSKINTRPISGNSNPELLFDSLKIGNTTYNNVLLFEANNDYYNTHVKAFFALYVGIIKYINQTDTFSIKKYRIL